MHGRWMPLAALVLAAGPTHAAPRFVTLHPKLDDAPRIVGAVDLSTRNDGCAPILVGGSIASVAYSGRPRRPEALRLRMTDGRVAVVNFDAIVVAGLSRSTIGDLSRLLARGSYVLVVASQCGASGSVLVVDGLYRQDYARAALAGTP